MDNTVSIVEFCKSKGRGRLAVRYGSPYPWHTWAQFVTWTGQNLGNYVADRFELEPEPVKLPDDRWAVVNQYGNSPDNMWRHKADAESWIADVNSFRDGKTICYRVVRVVFREIDDAK